MQIYLSIAVVKIGILTIDVFVWVEIALVDFKCMYLEIETKYFIESLLTRTAWIKALKYWQNKRKIVSKTSLVSCNSINASFMFSITVVGQI